ncbi:MULTISPECIES: YHS domain-containing (seleno)protein [Vibrio]|jgi:YHS domain-containing protein|uniref:YHS domain-containing protein n=1 Tax=Vibrio anguillarum TaxID=55601 RepID=A0ABD4QTR9_VIBAN|nr:MULTISPECIES: YHS domain-containing (seleno)protein [Vibrio]ASG00764.1 YHS domain protein [Vibrio anguillarum]ATC58531.1 YHS domain-containing protein [Vibrio anguillarum]AXN03149.1 YHS domain-containing protein [Vibrio anguillarum]MBF4251136.1 YHS domain-containing protein [Vibrio anguillarum]MBF4388781.1 YHS domain-containing protein [Vibrio anguillarum]
MKRLLGLLLLFVSSVSLAEDEIYTSFLSNKALSGYDTVAYFTEGEPVKGSSDFSTLYKNAQWYFSSKENLELFLNNPNQYAPQYGGYCAWAVSEKNDFAPGDPNQWAIVDGKLYLNYDKKIKTLWDANQAVHIQQADKNWPNLIK